MYIFPNYNMQDLNLDWILQQIKNMATAINEQTTNLENSLATQEQNNQEALNLSQYQSQVVASLLGYFPENSYNIVWEDGRIVSITFLRDLGDDVDTFCSAWLTDNASAITTALTNAQTAVTTAQNAAQIASSAVDVFENMVADEYDSTKTYNPGDYSIVEVPDPPDGVTHILYRCITQTTGSFEINDWVQVALANDITDLRKTVLQKTQNINYAKTGRYSMNDSHVINTTTSPNYYGMSDKIVCEPSTEYNIHIYGVPATTLTFYIGTWTSAGEYIITNTYYAITTFNKNFTTPANAGYIYVFTYSGSGINIDNAQIMISKGSTIYPNYIPYETAKDMIAETEITMLANSMNSYKETLDNKLGTYLTDCFEIGNIVMSNNGWVYGDGSGPTRVRTKERTTLRIKAGTIVGLTDYTNAKYYVGMRKNDGTYENRGWLTANYTVEVDCDCVILIANRTEVSQESPLPLASLFFGYSFTDYTRQNVYIDYDKIIKNINHRGYNLIAPENTLPAYQLSKLMGFNIVETDVSFTSDDVPVCLHDATINRTARNADGTTISETINIADITYQEALDYDFGIWKSAKYAGTKIPTLEQFFILCKNIGLNAYVEIKTDETYTESQIHDLLDLAKETGMYDRVTWISFLPTYLGYVKSYDANAKMIYVVSAITDEVITNANSLKNNGNLIALDAQYSVFNTTGMNKAIAAGIPVEIWTVNQENTVLSLPAYITGVTSDYTIAGKVLYERNIYKK